MKRTFHSQRVLRQQRCQRCGKKWLPRQPRKPVRCPGCKSPYWDKPRQLRSAVTRIHESVKKEELAATLGQTLTKAFGQEDDHQRDHEEMKATGRTWQEMADRLEWEFGTTLEKDQLKELVR